MNSSYLDAFLENAENLVDNGKVRVEDGLPKPETVAELNKLYKQLDLLHTDRETVRRLLQLDLLKVIRKDAVQANHQMTPDTLGIMMAYLIEKIIDRNHPYTIFDPAVGTANLLTTVMNHLQEAIDQPVQGYGIDNDDELLAVASVSVSLQREPVELFHQDAIEPLTIPQSDLAVSDLPVGYYPLDENTKNYQTRAEKGHSYVHHLLIEQSMNYLKPGGFGIFLVPSNLFQTEETMGFVKWIHSVAHFQGLINLPADLFKNQAAQKSILLLQRQGGGSHQAKQVLLGSFPSVKKRAEFVAFMNQIDAWVAANLKS